MKKFLVNLYLTRQETTLDGIRYAFNLFVFFVLCLLTHFKITPDMSSATQLLWVVIWLAATHVLILCALFLHMQYEDIGVPNEEMPF